MLPTPEKRLSLSLDLQVHSQPVMQHKMKMRKWIGADICDMFEGDNGLERHHGVVTDVSFHEIHVQYMFRCEYEDGDKTDYWRHGLEIILC